MTIHDQTLAVLGDRRDTSADLAWSALPHAPVLPDAPRPTAWRTSAADGLRRLAARLAPVDHPRPARTTA